MFLMEPIQYLLFILFRCQTLEPREFNFALVPFLSLHDQTSKCLHGVFIIITLLNRIFFSLKFNYLTIDIHIHVNTLFVPDISKNNFTFCLFFIDCLRLLMLSICVFFQCSFYINVLNCVVTST